MTAHDPQQRKAVEPGRTQLHRRALDEANCVGSNPDLFNHTTLPEASEALSICASCSFKGNGCNELIQPRSSYFDGVADGKVWQNGVEVTPKHRKPVGLSVGRRRIGCGTEIGIARHKRANEGLCDLCKSASPR